MEKTYKLTQERMKEVLSFDRNTGAFTWRVRAANRPIGSIAGTVGPNGYRYIRVDNRDYLAQRLAWFWEYNEWPSIIRFQNNDRLDCSIENLRNGFRLTTKFDHLTPEGRAAYGKAHRAAKPDHHRHLNLKKTFGISLDEYRAKLAQQGGVCAICQQPEKEMRGGQLKALAVDHDHDTGVIRDLLCSACNKMIGHACDDVSVLEAAIGYLRKHQSDRKVVAFPAR